MHMPARAQCCVNILTDLHLSTFNVRRIERNFFLSPMTIALLIQGSCAFTSSSIETGAMFSPPAVIISSYKNMRHLNVYHVTGLPKCSDEGI
jgi:hypothetical protein